MCNCTCGCYEDDCEESPLSSEPDSIRRPSGPIVPRVSLPIRPSPSPEEWRKYIQKGFWDRYPRVVKVNGPALITYTLNEVDCSPVEFRAWSESLGIYLKSVFSDPSGWMALTRGYNGGISLRQGMTPIQVEQERNQFKAEQAQVVNNYTCACGNDRLNKTEKSCWRCGAAIS